MRQAAGLAALLLAACQVPAPPGPAPEAPARATAKPASAKPAAALPGAAPTPGLRAAPAAGRAALAGVVRLDAAYMLATGAGRGVGADGQALVGLDGATAIAAAGAPLVAAGHAIAPLRPGADGTTLVGLDGGTLIGMDGSTLIGNDGSTLIGNDGSTYRLAQADAPTGVRRLAAAGMVVAAFSLRTGKPIPVGRGPGDVPIWGVYTDARGGFQLDVDPAEAGTLRLVAVPPRGADPALTAGSLARVADAAPLALDEDQDSAASYARSCFLTQLDTMLRDDVQGQVERIIADSWPDPSADPQGGLKRLEAAARATGYAALPAARREALLRRLGDRVLGEIDLGAVKMQGEQQSVLAYMAQAFAEDRDEVAARMRNLQPGETVETLWVGLPAVESRAPGFRFRCPADYNRFTVRHFFGKDPFDIPALVAGFAELRGQLGLPLKPEAERLRRMTAVYSLAFDGIGRHLFAREQDGAMPVIAALEAELQAQATAPR